MPPVRVVVAEDQALLREGIVRLLVDGGVDVAAAVGDADALREAAAVHAPDVVVVDVQMPPDHTDDGLRAAIELREQTPGLGVLVLSQHVEERYALDLVADDARGVGYLLKDRVTDVATLLDAVHRVAEGGSVLDPLVVGRMVGRVRREDSPLSSLTPREREVLALMAEGKSNPGIAAELAIRPAAAEKHAGNVFRKLGVGEAPTEHRRVMAVLTHLRAR